MSKILTIDELIDVIQQLEKARFDKTNWRTLGGTLGLHPNTLNMISANQRGDTDGCFGGCLSKWLRRADNVDKVGKPSLDTLANALEKMNGCKAQADYIRKLAREGDTGKTGEKNAKSTGPKIDSTKKSSKGGGAQARAGDEDIDGPDGQDPPQDKKCRKEEFSEDLVKDIEILLLPATDAEEEPVMEYLKESPEGYIETSIDGIVKMYIGYYGKRKVIVSKIAPDKTMQGPVHAAIITTKIIERVKSIKHVVAVGVCFGKDPEKQELGQVIVSEIICDFVSKRQGEDSELRRGGDYEVNRETKEMFNFSHNLVLPENIKVSPGPILTTPNVIDNPEIKKGLFDKKPEAVAGEMEGAGIMAAIGYVPQRVGGIVIKGIGDWADGKKKAAEDSKPTAARNAARYVYAALNK
ncbi:PREDICTED: uncharacterized protein LOC109586577 [Amphimedon queenslandica]|nr:PREDICTED: uncharacterized protein LOC109586577 [Amphimedon queenslandica]|eukprot:XP_019858340.1 PREDICTED: uncharacterized protein LOC109586577 [Amphimedon queenslandica]